MNGNNVYIENHPMPKRHFDHAQFDDTSGVLTQTQFLNKFVVPKNYQIFSIKNILGFTKALTSLIEKGETEGLSTEEYAELQKAMADSKNLQKVQYQSDTGQTVSVYVSKIEKAEADNDIEKSHITDALYYESGDLVFTKTGKEMKAGLRKLEKKHEEKLAVAKAKVDSILAQLPEDCQPDKPCRTYHLERIGIDPSDFPYKMISWEKMNNLQVEMNRFSNINELKIAADINASNAKRMANDKSKICDLYNGAVHEYSGEFAELQLIKSYMANIKDGSSYKLNQKQLILLFPAKS